MTEKSEVQSFDAWRRQQEKNRDLLLNSRILAGEVKSHVLPLKIAIDSDSQLSVETMLELEALQIEASRISINSLASLAKINELDHLGGGLDLISSLMLTLAVCDYEKIDYTIEHAHTSIGYYSCLAALGFLQAEMVIEGFRRGIEIPGHVSWVPGGTQLNGGRLGVMIPVAVGYALAKRATKGKGSWVITHCGDAGWISGQALNGFNGAHLHSAPVTFIMHRNGIQLSGATKTVMNKDPRPIIEALGVRIIEVPSLHDIKSLFTAYTEAFRLAQEGLPSLIYPVGFKSKGGQKIDLHEFGRMYGIYKETKSFSAKHNCPMEQEIWIPGSLMSFRDVESMLECLFLVNGISGGQGHHDGHMKNRDVATVLKNPMLQLSSRHQCALEALRNKKKRIVWTKARPASGSSNIVLDDVMVEGRNVPTIGTWVSPRAGSEEAYAMIAEFHPNSLFVVSCDLDVSTKLAKARKFLKNNHQFEMSIEEQASALMANGFSFSNEMPQLNVFSTFAAFFEGIAREGFEAWRYQRNLNGINEGLNVTFHLSHVGACTGRDHFSGWGLDWITLSLGYLPYLHRFYAPADARSAFIAVRDLASHYGGHIIGIPRDSLPILENQEGTAALWSLEMPWESVTTYRKYPDAKKAILAFGAPAYLGAEAAETLTNSGIPTDVLIVNGLPLPQAFLESIFSRYPEGIVTIEDGIIGTKTNGLRGFASVIFSAGSRSGVPLNHVGIVDPRIAPSEGHLKTWDHFGITSEALVQAVCDL